MKNNRLPAEFSASIIQKAIELGFDACGISDAKRLEDHASHMEHWLSKGLQAGMSYLERNREKRYNPSLLVEHTISVISVLLNYYPSEKLDNENAYLISKYAFGEDYHTLVKNKLHLLMGWLKQQFPEITGRAFTDSAPFLDRAWAQQSGLGFIGKNTCLIHPRKGSFHFIGHLVVSIPLHETGNDVFDYCGTCSRCIDSCPTQALIAPHILDASRCISYLTIEHRGELEQNTNLHQWIFGCDICQDVCPWNRFSKPTTEEKFRLNKVLKKFNRSNWQNLSEEQFDQIFEKSAVKRAGYSGLMRNIRAVESFQNAENQ